MGVHHESGYSARVEGFLDIGGQRVRVAKSNGSTFALAEACELTPGTVGQLIVIVDGKETTRLVRLPKGVKSGQSIVEYEVAAPF